MSVRFLLDTDILSEPTRPRPDALVMDRFRKHAGETATAAVVWHELTFGLARLAPSRKRESLERYLRETLGATFAVLPYDRAAAAWHGHERARLGSLGKALPVMDAQIAAIAATNDLTLVTRNTRHYDQFHGLRLANWFVP